LGIKTTEAELSVLASTTKRGSSMLGLAKAAKAKGLRTCGLFLTFDDLIKINKPVIAFINNSHFVVINKIKKDKILIIDPSVGKVLLEKKIFMKIWKRICIGIREGR